MTDNEQAARDAATIEAMRELLTNGNLPHGEFKLERMSEEAHLKYVYVGAVGYDENGKSTGVIAEFEVYNGYDIEGRFTPMEYPEVHFILQARPFVDAALSQIDALTARAEAAEAECARLRSLEEVPKERFQYDYGIGIWCKVQVVDQLPDTLWCLRKKAESSDG